MVSSFPLKKNTATKIVFPILDADGDLVTGATALDSEYSLDGGTFVDCASEATEIATSSGIYYLDLAAGETNGDVVAIQIKTTTSGAKTTVLVFYTAAQTLDEVQTAITVIDDYVDTEIAAIKAKTDLIGTSVALETGGNVAAIKAKTDLIGASVALETGGNIATILADTNELQTDWVNGGRLDLLIDAIKAKTDTIPTNPATEAKQDTIIGYIDTEVAAIKAVTDTLSLTAIADAVHDEVTEGTTTLRHTIKLISSALFAKTSGGGTATLIARDIGDTKARITVTADADGNRTAVTLDGT